MKQHPDSVNRDFDDDVAEAIEHQYAQKLMKRAARSDGTSQQEKQSAKSKAEDESLDAGMDQLRDKSGF
jgi:hypothetical protein